MGAEEVEVQPDMLHGRWAAKAGHSPLSGGHLQVGHGSDLQTLATGQLGTVDFRQTDHSRVHAGHAPSVHAVRDACFMRGTPEMVRLSGEQDGAGTCSVLRTVTVHGISATQADSQAPTPVLHQHPVKSGRFLAFGRAMLRRLLCRG